MPVTFVSVDVVAASAVASDVSFRAEADTGVEVLGAPETSDILVETAQSKAVSRPAGDVTGSLEEIETVLGHLRYELVIRHDLTQSQS